MARHKEFDRVNRQFNIDRVIDEWLRRKYPNQASKIVNELLITKRASEEKFEQTLIGNDTNAGRLAYVQAMEQLSLLPDTNWKELTSDDQLKFLDLYKKKLILLRSRGF